jgi:uncharacterized protein (TIGR03437 family)
MFRPLLLILFSTGILPAQTPAAGGVVAAGYDVPPTRISVAPGQVITFFVHGIGLGLSGPVRASSGQWPTTLGGISANFVQSGTTPVPLLSVEPITTCDNPSPGCGSYTAVTLQVPFGIAATNPGASILGGPPPFGTVQFVENGTVQSGVEVTTYVDQIHLLRYCDLLFSPRGGCQPVATHSDGTSITILSPATAGEHVVLYAVGLGNVDPLPSTGIPFAPGGKVAPFGVSFDPRPNALASRPPAVSDASGILVPATVPEFVGPVAGFVGLYQINVRIPQLPPGLPGCELNGSSVATSVQSNMTINLGGVASFDGAPVCVKPPS